MTAWRQAARLGAVIHGPEVIDSGEALKLISYLQKFGGVKAVLGGTMGRVAVIDSGLEDTIAVSPKRRPSESLKDLQPSSDILVLVNQAKTRETGLAFGSVVAENAGIIKPLLQIDFGGKFVAVLAGAEGNIAEEISYDLGFDQIKWAEFQYSRAGNIVHEGNVTKRRLTGVLPGELITVNGIVIAKAIDRSIEIEESSGRIVKVAGAEMKLHGVQKLPQLDLESAIVRSGNIRRTEAKPRNSPGGKGSFAVLINHNAEDAFEISRDACIAVTVGDDTTAIAGDILSRLGMPIIGITDGDLDGLSQGIAGISDGDSMDIAANIVERVAIQKGSILIRVQAGFDDVIGAQVQEQIFKGMDRAQIKASDLADRIIEIARSHLVRIESI